MKRLLILIVLLSSLQGLLGQNFKTAAAKARSDRLAAVKELESLRNTIAKEKIPLVSDLDILDNQVIAQIEEVRVLEREKSRRNRDFDSLKSDLNRHQVQYDYMTSLLSEFDNGFANRIHHSENQIFKEERTRSKNKLKGGQLGEAEELAERVKALQRSMGRLLNAMGGHIYSGNAMAPNDEQSSGKFVMVGPLSYFSSSDGEVAGIVAPASGKAWPQVEDAGDAIGAGAFSVAGSGKGLLPLDPTLGKAIRVKAARGSLIDQVRKGRVVGYCILGLGGLALLIAIFKAIEILHFRVPQSDVINDIVDHLLHGRFLEARDLAQAISGPAGQLMITGVDQFGTKRRVLEELLYEKLLSIRPKLERFLPFLAVTVAAAPLMGLLGTVIGMIKTFALITEFGTGDARSLASGISEALVTTALGLVVAIPILIIHGVLVRMARGRSDQLELAAMAFLNALSKHNAGLKSGKKSNANK